MTDASRPFALYSSQLLRALPSYLMLLIRNHPDFKTWQPFADDIHGLVIDDIRLSNTPRHQRHTASAESVVGAVLGELRSMRHPDSFHAGRTRDLFRRYATSVILDYAAILRVQKLPGWQDEVTKTQAANMVVVQRFPHADVWGFGMLTPGEITVLKTYSASALPIARQQQCAFWLQPVLLPFVLSMADVGVPN